MSERTLEDFLADPQASQEELTELAKELPAEVLAHPNCPVSVWWKLAARMPIQAMRSPLWELNLLEEPERWLQIENNRVGTWLDWQGDKLSARDKRLFAADCAAHVLPIFEREYPHDLRPREAITAARAYAMDRCTAAEMQAASEAAGQSLTSATKLHVWEVVATVMHASRLAQSRPAGSTIDIKKETELQAVLITARKAAANVPGREKTDPTMIEEKLWQWRRLAEYLLGKAAPMEVARVKAKKQPRRR